MDLQQFDRTNACYIQRQFCYNKQSKPTVNLIEILNIDEFKTGQS